MLNTVVSVGVGTGQVLPELLPFEIPSPTSGVWWLGPIPIRGYALSILTGIVVAVWVTRRRLQARTGDGNKVLDVAAWAVPFGILGGRIYHLITTPQPYFGAGGDPWKAFRVWEGGLGIWGAIAMGALGAWLGCRRAGVRFADFADAAAPGLFVAQALGRVGNYFNNEIYGPATDLPWALRIYHWDAQAGHAVFDAAGDPIVKGLYHPTFLYEGLWCLFMAGLLLWVDRRRDLRPGQVFALVPAGYALGRLPIELIRTDEANHILGMRVNVWVSIFVFLLGIWLYRRAGRTTVREAAEESPDSSSAPA
ncbi:MAG: prolipoprotein diacylglyceryl transferase [Actinomycetales bacterium]|nr:MAG: prolipoprotein diacylglyceryl transferase [Actinomycetales bacterium]